MRRRTALAAAGALLAGGTIIPAARAVTPKDILVVAQNLDDLISLDPAETFELSGGEIIAQFYDRLVTVHPTDPTRVIGSVAERWTIDEAGRTVTFQIAQGRKFHSGNPITAEDAAYSIRRVVTLGLPPAMILTQFGWTALNVAELVRAEGPDRLVVTLAADLPPALLLGALSAGVGSVVDAQLVQGKAKGEDLGLGWLRQNSAGSGAFRLLQWRPKDAVALQANPDYYRGRPRMNRLLLRHVPDPALQRFQLDKNDTDIARGLTAEQVTTFAANPQYVVHTMRRDTILYLGLNQGNAVLAHPMIREAVHWAVDYHGIADTLLKGQWQVHQSCLPVGTLAALAELPYRLDLPRARELVKASSLVKPKVRLGTPNGWPYLDIAKKIQDGLEEAGIDVELVAVDQRQSLADYRARQHDIVLARWAPDYPDPHSSTAFFVQNPDNGEEAVDQSLAWRNRWLAPELARDAQAALRERDRAARVNAYLAIQRRLQADSPYVFMFQQVAQTVSRAIVTGLEMGPAFDSVRFARAGK